MAKDHRDSTDNLNDDSIEAQPGPATDNLTKSPTVKSAVQNPDKAPRQQKRAAKRAALKPQDVSNVNPTNSNALGAAVTINSKDLDDRKILGMLLAAEMRENPANCIIVDSVTTMYVSLTDETRIYTVKREERNVRGTMKAEYRCACADFIKDGRNDCKHIFAERLRRGEFVVVGEVKATHEQVTNAERRAARKRKAFDGRPIRSSQREARVKMSSEVPRLITSLSTAYDRSQPKASTRRRGGQMTSNSTRAVSLLHKISRRKSADEMVSIYEQLIESGFLRLRKAPHQNTLSDWMNDPALTPVLYELLRLTTLPFRKREIAAIIDSSKMSQMSSAHSRGVEYLHDVRPGADWMKCHALVGVETMIVMAVEFSGSTGPNTHDVNFIKPLVTEAIKTFPLQCLLGDKAYFAKEYFDWLWYECNMRAFIPIKKNIQRSPKTMFYEPLPEMISMFDDRQREFHEVYRLRTKIEGFFSILKRIAGDHCWSRGRPRAIKNAEDPSVAWKNETLCKFIFMNLRTTVTLQEETGYTIDYATDRFFPAPMEPLIIAA